SLVKRCSGQAAGCCAEYTEIHSRSRTSGRVRSLRRPSRNGGVRSRRARKTRLTVPSETPELSAVALWMGMVPWRSWAARDATSSVFNDRHTFRIFEHCEKLNTGLVAVGSVPHAAV